MKVLNDDTFTGKFNLCGITLVDFSRKVPVNQIMYFDHLTPILETQCSGCDRTFTR